MLLGCVRTGGGADRLRGPQQVGEQPFRGEERPQLVDRPGDARLAPQPVARVGQVLVVERAAEDAGFGPGKLIEQVRDEQLARDVVRPAGGTGPVAGAEDRRAGKRDVDAVGVDRDVVPGRPLPVADRLLDDADHPLVALDDGGGIAGVRRVHAGEDVAERVQYHVGLAEGRQHLADVAQERGVRADDQDAAALEGAAVGVQEVSGAVQRGDGLAGAGAALDDQDSRQVSADYSAWMVATTSAIRPVRAEETAAISAASPERVLLSLSDNLSRSNTSSSTPVTTRCLV